MQHKAVTALATALASAVVWFAWLGWDTTYRTDPATGDTSGPYELWQVLGAVLALVLVTVIASRRLSVLVGALAVAVGFATAWTVTSARDDESGLWVIGLVLVLLGTLAGAALVGGTARMVQRRASRPAGQQ